MMGNNNSSSQSGNESSFLNIPFVRVEVDPEEDNEEEEVNNATVVDVDITLMISVSTVLHDIDDAAIQYPNVKIPEEWNDCLQDMGCSKSELKIKRYKGSQTPGRGPKDVPIFYYHLTSIAIDYIKNF